jgi:hypothetical protein
MVGSFLGVSCQPFTASYPAFYYGPSINQSLSRLFMKSKSSSTHIHDDKHRSSTPRFPSPCTIDQCARVHFSDYPTPSFGSSFQQQDQSPSSDPLFPSDEAETYIGVAKGTMSVWRCSKRYGIPYIKVGRLVRYRKSA